MSTTPDSVIFTPRSTSPVDSNPGIGSFGAALNPSSTPYTPKTSATPSARPWGTVPNVPNRAPQRVPEPEPEPEEKPGEPEEPEESEESEEPEDDEEAKLVAKLEALRKKKAASKKSESSKLVKFRPDVGLVPTKKARNAAIAAFTDFTSPVGGPSGPSGQIHYYAAPVTYNISNHYHK